MILKSEERETILHGLSDLIVKPFTGKISPDSLFFRNILQNDRCHKTFLAVKRLHELNDLNELQVTIWSNLQAALRGLQRKQPHSGGQRQQLR